MRSEMMKDLLEGRKYPSDLLVVIFFSGIGLAVSALLPDGHIIRVILAIPFVIFFPGYVATALLWPEKKTTVGSQKKDEESASKSEIDIMERFALSFGLSILIITTMAFSLNYFWKLTPFSVLIGTFFITILLAFASIRRRQMLPLEERFALSLRSEGIHRSSEWSQTDKIISVILAISVIVSAFALSYVILKPTEGEKYTEFYVLNQSGTSLPNKNFAVNENCQVTVGIVCHEFSNTNYTVVIGLDNSTSTEYHQDWSQVFDLTNYTEIAKNLTLKHEKTFENTFAFRLTAPSVYNISLRLLINGQSTDYELHFKVNVE